MLNDWSHKVRAIFKKYCPGNIKRILPSSQSAWNTRFYFGHQKLCMDNNRIYSHQDFWQNMHARCMPYRWWNRVLAIVVHTDSSLCIYSSGNNLFAKIISSYGHGK